MQLGIASAAQRLGFAGQIEQASAQRRRIAILTGIAAGDDINPLAALVIDLIEHGAATEHIGLFDGFGIGGDCASAQGGGGGSRARGQGAQQGEGRPPTHALAMAIAAGGIGHRLAGVAQHPLEQAAIPLAEAIGGVAVIALGEGRIGVEVVANVTAPALDEMGGQAAAVSLVLRAAQVAGQIGKRRIEQFQQRAEGRFIAAMRRRGDEDEMALAIGGQRLDQRVALVLAATPFETKGAGVGFVHDHEIGAGAQELIAAALGLDEIERHDHVV